MLRLVSPKTAMICDYTDFLFAEVRLGANRDAVDRSAKLGKGYDKQMSEPTLLNRLRKLGFGQHYGPMAKACAEAADEIERLRADLVQAQKIYHDTQWRQLNEAQAEVERLRALLAMAVPYVDGPTEPGPSLRATINEAIKKPRQPMADRAV